MNEIKEFILNNDIILIVTTPSVKTLIITNILNQLSIKDKYKTHLFSFNIRSEYYSHKLISLISGINTKLITKYNYPHVSLSKNNVEKINRDKFIDAIEKIQNSNILISSNKSFNDNEYINYILNEVETNVLIIDNLYTFLDKTTYNLEEILKRLKRGNNKHLVLFMSVKKEEQNNIIKKINSYIKNFILVDGYNYLKYKDVNIKILNSKIETNFNLKLDKENRIIKNMEENK